MVTMTLLTLQEIADETGVSIRRLRYYIGKGWLPQPDTRPEGPGRPPQVLPSGVVPKVQLIDRIVHPTASDVIVAPTLGVYVYEDDGKRVQVDIVSREEHGLYVLLALRNGDFILRRKGAVSDASNEG